MGFAHPHDGWTSLCIKSCHCFNQSQGKLTSYQGIEITVTHIHTARFEAWIVGNMSTSFCSETTVTVVLCGPTGSLKPCLPVITAYKTPPLSAGDSSRQYQVNSSWHSGLTHRTPQLIHLFQTHWLQQQSCSVITTVLYMFNIKICIYM